MMRFRSPLRSPFRWDPWHEIEDLRRTLEHLGARSLPRMPATATTTTLDFMPDTDVFDAGTAFVVRVDLPGVPEKDLEVTAEGSTLTIRGRRAATVAKDEAALGCERPVGQFARTIELPEAVDDDHVTATLKLGVLEITLAKSKNTAVKKVAVTADEDA